MCENFSSFDQPGIPYLYSAPCISFVNDIMVIVESGGGAVEMVAKYAKYAKFRFTEPSLRVDIVSVVFCILSM